MTRGGGTTGLDQASQVLMVADQVVNLTAKIWSLIEKNQPVVTIPGKSPYATAVPKGIKTWTYLTGWKGPKTVVKRFTCKNLYGMKVIDIRYAVSYAYAGSYRGKGRYLTAVSAEPVSVNVLWGYKLSMSAEVPDPTVINKGTVANPMVMIGVVKIIFSFIGGWVQKVVPQAGLLGSLAGIGLVLIGFVPIVEIFSLPLVGLISLGIILYTLVAKIRLPKNFPGVLLAVALGTALYYILGPMPQDRI